MAANICQDRHGYIKLYDIKHYLCAVIDLQFELVSSDFSIQIFQVESLICY